MEASAEPGTGPVDLDLLADRVRFTLARVGVPRATVGLMVIGPDEMARINGEHRDKPVPTDVLSFESDDPAYAGDVALCVMQDGVAIRRDGRWLGVARGSPRSCTATNLSGGCRSRRAT